jgi:protocatechuate 3,4-dioxygenase beta subunit
MVECHLRIFILGGHMTRRQLSGLTAAAAFTALLGHALLAQDVEYIRAMERAQSSRPATLSSTARSAPPDEPGDPLAIHGRLLTVDGSPAADAVVFAYHTDKGGLYDKRENGPHSWRLRGWVKTGADGSFTFTTIRPGSYPNSNNPPHVHFTAFLPNGERYHAGELQLSMTRPVNVPMPEQATIELRLRARDRF